MTYEAEAGIGSGQRTISAFFENRQSADAAIDRLIAEGFSRDSIRIVPGSESTSSTTGTLATGDSGGFWDSLREFFLPDEDRHVYAEGLSRGGLFVSLTPATSAQYERAPDILDDEGTIDLDQRETQWRSEGWNGYTGSDYAASGAATGLGLGGADYAASTSTDLGATTTNLAGSATGAGALAGNEEIIQIAEEQLRVGKRDVSHGRVRVRSYVVETPVSEQVNLREERVNVERRAVDQPLSGTENLFQERTIDVEQRAEEAVVSKDARITEELVISKDVEQRTETVSGTVKHTEVEVQDERGNVVGGATGTTGLAGTTTPRR